MTNNEYNEKIEKLIKWAHAYYVEDNPQASDEEYDLLSRECLAYEQDKPALSHPNSPNKRVGGFVLEGFNKANHLSRMWSQEDVFDTQELVDWINRAKKCSEQGHQTAIFGGETGVTPWPVPDRAPKWWKPVLFPQFQ